MFRTTKIDLRPVDTQSIAEAMIKKMSHRMVQLKNRKELSRAELTELRHLRAGANLLVNATKENK